MFDADGEICHGGDMRRPVALFTLLALAAVMTAPAIAACRMRAAEESCCCEPAPPNTLCAPDCCGQLEAQPRGDVSTHLRGLLLSSQVASPSAFTVEKPAISAALPAAPLRVRLHQRSAPRLPLRI